MHLLGILSAAAILYSCMLFCVFVVKCVFSTTAIPFAVLLLRMKHALRQTANLSNQSLFVHAVCLEKKIAFTPTLFELPVVVQVIIVVFEYRQGFFVFWSFCRLYSVYLSLIHI